MVVIRPLPSIDASLLERLITGYTSTEMYRVTRDETPDTIRFELRLTTLEQPFVKRYPPLDSAELQRYRDLAAAGQAFGAFEGETCIGIALCEPQRWNSSLTVWEFHIAPKHRRQGVGRALMAAVEAHARDEGLRCLVCETQTTNVPAIRFYRALGFTIDAVDVSLYANDDIERGEVAVFMKKRITDPLSDEA
ncbi:MAG TPA: GNAT family N-acetyltransferase [Ktedonobacterales bacterium]|jgi:ribosomal protein S18 acetylase RimI-like enzyme